MKRWLGCFVGLALFGVVVWGTADEMRNRPEWRQWLILAFWTAMGAMILSWVVEAAHKSGADEMDTEWLAKVDRWLDEGVLLEGGDPTG